MVLKCVCSERDVGQHTHIHKSDQVALRVPLNYIGVARFQVACSKNPKFTQTMNEFWLSFIHFHSMYCSTVYICAISICLMLTLCVLRCLIGTNIWVCPHLDTYLGHVGCAVLGMMLIAVGEVHSRFFQLDVAEEW